MFLQRINNLEVSKPNSFGNFVPTKKWCFERIGMNFETAANTVEDNNMSDIVVKGLFSNIMYFSRKREAL